MKIKSILRLNKFNSFMKIKRRSGAGGSTSASLIHGILQLYRKFEIQSEIYVHFLILICSYSSRSVLRRHLGFVHIFIKEIATPQTNPPGQ